MSDTPTTWIAARLRALRYQSAAAWDRAIAACGDDAEDLRAARGDAMLDWDAAIEAVDLPSYYDIDYDVAVARQRTDSAKLNAEDWRLDAQAERDACDALRCQCGDATGQPCAAAQGGAVVLWVPEHLRGTCRAAGDDGIPHAAMRLSVAEQCVDDLLELGRDWAREEDVADADTDNATVSLEVRAREWAGSYAGEAWRPAVDGSLNATEASADAASRFRSPAEAQEFVRASLPEAVPVDDETWEIRDDDGAVVAALRLRRGAVEGEGAEALEAGE